MEEPVERLLRTQPSQIRNSQQRLPLKDQVPSSSASLSLFLARSLFRKSKEKMSDVF